MAAIVAVAAGLAGCSAPTVKQVEADQAKIVVLCKEALPLAGVLPSVGVYVEAACASEEAIAKVALNPGTVAWLQKLLAELRGAVHV